MTETPNIISTKISNWSSKAAPFVKPWEGLELVAKDDGFGNPTIGWGHTKGVKLGQKIDIPTAERLLDADLQDAALDLMTLVHVPLNDNQAAAMISLIFNVGAANLKHSHIIALINMSEFDRAAAEFVRWDHANGRVVKGLLRRREAEAELFKKKA